nr:uncharacterized protein LOC129269404 isoform X1 [Lytechinus pictus]XP_054762874.1 uncharacterized protein LOC129269404 isoform X1 [Lytechinus pictus]XP_054762875.1 uncharacterized protein LOC129269404 isoform X1 [Lytechinus pictus]
MPRNTDNGSSGTGTVTPSSTALIDGDARKRLHLTVPCSVTLDKLRESSNKFVLKHGSGYYTITKGDSLRYRIEGIKVLRTRNRSMPTSTKKGGNKMNRPDPRGEGYRRFPPSRESSFLNATQGDYEGRFDGRYSGPYQSRGRDNRYEQRRHWPPRGNYGKRGSRDSYSREFNNSSGQFGRRASSYPDEAIGEHSRFERFPQGDRDGAVRFQDRQGRYPSQKRRHQSGSSLEDVPKPLASTYKKANKAELSNHAVLQKTPVNEDSKQLSKESKLSKDNALDNERTTQNHNLNNDKANPCGASPGLSNSGANKASQAILNETAKPNTEKQKRKAVLTMSQQIESLRSKPPKTNVDQTKERSAKKPEGVSVPISRTGNGDNAKGSPHRTEISVPNHIDGVNSSAKETEGSSSRESENAGASPRRLHSARKSAPTSGVSRTQKSDMLKKQALLKQSQIASSPPPDNASSTLSARMGVKERKPYQKDSAESSPVSVSEEKDTSKSLNDPSRTLSEEAPISLTEEALTPPPSEDLVVLSDTEGSVMETGLQDKEVVSEERELGKSKEPENKVEDQKAVSDDSPATSITRDFVKSGDPEMSSAVGKMVFKIKENLKKKLSKGNISPRTSSSSSSRVGSRPSSSCSIESLMDVSEKTDTLDTDIPEDHLKEKNEISAENSSLPDQNNECEMSSEIPDNEHKVNGKEVSEDTLSNENTCTGDNKITKCDAMDIVGADEQASHPDGVQSLDGETQPFQVSIEPSADQIDHICKVVLDDSSKISSATENSDIVNSQHINDEIVKTATCNSLPEQSEEASLIKDDAVLPKAAENIEEISDGSVDLGPHEPGDMDAIDDDLLLEDDPVMSEGYNPEPDKMDTSELSEAQDCEVTELAITKVESQSEDVLQAGWDQPTTSKRTLTGDVEDVEGEPVCKKSRTENENVIEGIECPTESEEVADLEASKKPVIFSHSEWKDFAQSIKEKYERLVQTFNQKTNVMYEAQAHWQQESNSWKDRYDKLERKYEDLLIQVKERSVVEKQDVEVQTTFTHKTKLSRRKKEGSQQGTPKSSQEKPVEEGEAMETEQGTTSSSEVPALSGTPPPTSDFEPSAASSSSKSNSSPDIPGSSKSTHLESKREVFRATLNKVMQNKKNLSGASEAGTSSDAPSGKASQDTASLSKADAHVESTEKPGGITDGAAALETDQSSEESPMDTSLAGSNTTDPSPTADAASTQSMQTKGPNVAINASGTATAASHPQETISSAPTPSNIETSKGSSDSEAVSSQDIPSPSKSLSSTSGTGPAESPSKAPSESPEKANVPSGTDSSKLPGSPKHSTDTASTKVPEASNDTSKKSNSTEKKKDPSAGKPTKSAPAQDEPEVIDLTDDPELPAEKSSKPCGSSPHKQDSLPISKFTSLTTKSPHTLVNSPSVSSPNALERAPSVFVVSSSITTPTTSGTVSSARQVANIGQNLVSQNAIQRTSQRVAAVQPVSIASRTGSMSGSVSSPKRISPGVPQSISPHKQSSSSANIQLRNVNPPLVTTQGSNLRSQVVSLQHGPRQQVPPASRGQPQTSQVSAQQRQMSSSQQSVTATIAGLQPVMTTMQNQARMQGQVAMAQRLQQEQQQISLNMLQQGRQGVHQLPGAAASAAALATRQPGQAWLQQVRPGQVTSTQQQSLQVCQQIQLPTGQIQLQMVRPVGAGAPQTLPTSTLASGSQLAIQQQQHYQNVARSQASNQEQIQAQERTHAANRAQAAAKAAREQREQEQHQQARIAAQRLQSSQQDQQQVQRAQMKKLQEEQSAVKTQQQQHQNKMRLILSQIQRSEEYQQSLRTKLSATHSGMNRQVYRNCQRQLQDMQQQEGKLRSELGIVEKALAECRNKSNKLEQQLRMTTITASASRLSPQELQQHQLQQQQQQLNQQLAQRQIQQQRNPQQQQQQQQQQGQLQVQQKQDMTKSQKHPAPLPDMKTTLDLPRTILFTPLPIRPLLEIKHSQEGIVLSWKADPAGGASKVEVMRYLLYAYQESESATPSTDLWKKIGAVDALPLPMACTLTHFKAGSMYHFAVCAISKHKRPGAFSNIGSINLP